MTALNLLATNRAWCPACGQFHADLPDGDVRCSCGQPLRISENSIDSFAARGVGAQLEPRRAARFLSTLANLNASPGDSDKARMVFRAFRKFFPDWLPGDSMIGRDVMRSLKLRRIDPGETSSEEVLLGYLIALQNSLRAVWGTSEPDERTWRAVSLRKLAWDITTHPSTDPIVLKRLQESMLPPEDTLQQAMIYFQKRRAVTRECANPRCQIERFFFASKPRQVYCSTSCSSEMDKAKKLLWWNEKGRKLRDQKSRKGGKRGKK